MCVIVKEAVKVLTKRLQEALHLHNTCATPYIAASSNPPSHPMKSAMLYSHPKHVLLMHLPVTLFACVSMQVRTLVRERLADMPPLSRGVSHKVRKKRRAVPSLPGGAPRAGSLTEGRPGTAGGDAASLTSAAYTYRTASTFKTQASRPDFLRLPGEYEKVSTTSPDE